MGLRFWDLELEDEFSRATIWGLPLHTLKFDCSCSLDTPRLDIGFKKHLHAQVCVFLFIRHPKIGYWILKTIYTLKFACSCSLDTPRLDIGCLKPFTRSSLLVLVH